MTGARDANLRAGHLAEARGAHAFQDFAAVARVPLEADVGNDAICTLLRRRTSRNLVAADSFWVQFKAGPLFHVRDATSYRCRLVRTAKRRYKRDEGYWDPAGHPEVGNPRHRSRPSAQPIIESRRPCRT
jgi:hypothetical protein